MAQTAPAPGPRPHDRVVPRSGRLRWAAKKAARRGMAFAPPLVARMRPLAIGRIRVLTYHRFGVCVRDPFMVTPAAFAAQMAWVAERGLALTLAETLAVARGESRLPGDRVLITIDDGWRSIMTGALPTLRAHRLPAVLFLSVGTVDTGGAPAPGAAPFEPAIDWRDAAALVADGITIGSHGWTHRSMTALPLAEARRELLESRQALEQRLGVAVTSFAFPFGTAADCSPELESLLAECGYTSAFTAQHGSIGAGAPLFALPRIKVEGGESLAMFRRLCAGGLDAWSHLDRHLWWLQARVR